MNTSNQVSETPVKEAKTYIRKVMGWRDNRTSSGTLWYCELKLECGHTTSTKEWYCAPNNGKNIPSECECPVCRKIDEVLPRLPELLANSIYSRVRGNHADPDGGYITFYTADSSSPSGVRSIGGVPRYKEIDAEISRLSNKSPLSPTEGLIRSR